MASCVRYKLSHSPWALIVSTLFNSFYSVLVLFKLRWLLHPVTWLDYVSTHALHMLPHLSLLEEWRLCRRNSDLMQLNVKIITSVKHFISHKYMILKVWVLMSNSHSCVVILKVHHTEIRSTLLRVKVCILMWTYFWQYETTNDVIISLLITFSN